MVLNIETSDCMPGIYWKKTLLCTFREQTRNRISLMYKCLKMFWGNKCVANVEWCSMMEVPILHGSVALTAIAIFVSWKFFFSDMYDKRRYDDILCDEADFTSNCINNDQLFYFIHIFKFCTYHILYFLLLEWELYLHFKMATGGLPCIICTDCEWIVFLWKNEAEIPNRGLPRVSMVPVLFRVLLVCECITILPSFLTQWR